MTSAFGGLGQRWIEKYGAVTAARLGFVYGQFGMAQQGGRIAAVTGKQRNTDAGVELQRRTGNKIRLAQDLKNTADDVLYRFPMTQVL